MDSIGIYYTFKANKTPNDPTSTISTDLHVNYIKGKSTNNDGYKRILDFGLKIIDDARKVDSIYFYFPFTITENNISDLGEKCSNHEFLSILFNDNYTVSNDSNNNYCKVEPVSSEKETFYFYKLGKENYNIRTISNNHTLLQIQIKSLPRQNGVEAKDKEKLSIYFRFRLRDLPINSIFHLENMSNNFLQSAFSKVEMLDFSINEIRKMNAKVQEELSADNRIALRFKKIHFHFIGSSDDEHIDGSTHYRDCALLDAERWGNYLSDIDIKKHQCIAYHWCVKSEDEKTIPGYNIFFRSTFKDLSWKTLIKYILIMVAFGVAGSGIVEGIVFLITNLLKA
ncbi:MAG: hypothetical protein IKZ52_06250 [Bacteroidales bacterium]|nr:hypothetical protein [Bacteroidales bacterium]